MCAEFTGAPVAPRPPGAGGPGWGAVHARQSRPMPDASTPIATSTIATLAKSDNNLVWLDCEMSGLEPDAIRKMPFMISRITIVIR